MIRVPLLQKQISFAFSLLITCLLTFYIVQCLSFLNNTVSPEVYLGRVAVSLLGFFISILGGWISFQLVGGIIFAAFASMIALFAATVSKSSIFTWFLVEYIFLCFILYRVDEYFENCVLDHLANREKFQTEKNDLQVSYKTKGEGISIFFEKYSTYYHLRKLAEELVTSLSVTELSEMIVSRCTEFVSTGDIALISLGDIEGQNLSVIASKQVHQEALVESKQGDMFDVWVIRNRKRAIISDTHQDFRFDVTRAVREISVRSLVIVPLFNEGRVMGTLRMNSNQPGTFENDHLRLLDAIGTLASSALSNATLYEKTEELAIRDSLTGLYVRRYFYERLKQEHRRFLLTKRPVSLLMCDLDHFKNCNDQYGHAVGDLMLVKLAEILRESAEGGLVARYGGEEFSILLMEVSKEKAARIAEDICRNVQNAVFQVRREKIQMTVSLGVASLPEDTLDIEELVQKADDALYRAKRQGRNQVCLNEG